LKFILITKLSSFLFSFFLYEDMNFYIFKIHHRSNIQTKY
jgi:hypothetical protein